MKSNGYLYPMWAAVVLSTSSLLLIYPDILRIAPDLQDSFLTIKLVLASLGYLLAFYFLRSRKANDLAIALLFLISLTYCLAMLWFLPLYEFALVQCAFGAAFFKTERKWLFPTVFGLGSLAFLTTYIIQDSMSWTLPPTNYKDRVVIILVCFVLTWMIHRYLIENSRKEQEKLLRLSLIGHETHRLLHDVKGMISSPLLIAETISTSSHAWEPEEHRVQTQRLAEEIRHVREVLRAINQIAKTSPVLGKVCIRNVIEKNTKILARRLSGVEISFPEPNEIESDENILHSTFFNLLLNSIEAFENNKTQNPKIDIQWKKMTLIYKDNAGPSTKAGNYSGNSGLGLEIIKVDLNSLGISHKIDFRDTGVEVSMSFKKALP